MSYVNCWEHMSLQKSESHILPPLQRRILLYLAETTPQTIRAIATNISKEYRSTWRSFNSLKAKGLIDETDVKTYRGQAYPQYWLTDEGVLIATIEGAPVDVMLTKTQKIFPENRLLHCFLEIAPLFNPDVFRIGYSAVKNKGQIQDIDFATMLFFVLLTDIPIQTYKGVFKTLQKYPKEYELLKTQIENISLAINQLKKIIQEQENYVTSDYELENP